MANIFGKIKRIYMILVISMVLILVVGIVFVVIFLLNKLGLLSDDDLSSFTEISSSSSTSISSFEQYYQGDYSDVEYGSGTIKSCGCGPTSFAMVASTILGKSITPADAVSWCGNAYYVSGQGTSWSYFSAAKDHFDVPGTLITTTNIDTVYTALQSGSLVISSQSKGIFTSGGHYIVLAGIYSDGGIIVRDPNKNNAVTKGYNTRSFSKSEISESAKNYWIFTY